MRAACFIPIKAHSERVQGKNLRLLNGKKLYEYIFEHVNMADIFDAVYVDTNSEEVAEAAKRHGFSVIERTVELAKDDANGNDFIKYHYKTFPDFDMYFQAFATAPYLRPESMKQCFEVLSSSEEYDSCFTATSSCGFYWYAGVPLTYRPGIMPRSQDLKPILEETTGFYGVKKGAIERYGCRIGKNPYIHIVSKFEAVDINTEEDFRIAEYVGKVVYGL